MVPLLALTFATAFPQFDQKILQNQVAVHGGHSDPLPSWTPTPPADRLVGVAYSPWFDFPMKWASQGGCTWGMPSLGAYNSSDAAILRQHAVWLRDAGVDFVLMDWSNDAAYEPDNNEGLDRRDLKAIEDKAPLRKNVTQDDVGNTAAFLLSSMSNGITGQVIYVDSGVSIMGA